MKTVRYRIGQDTYAGELDGAKIARFEGDIFAGKKSGQSDALADATLLSPLEKGRVIGVGFNYKAHIKETGRATPEIPCLFMKPFTSVVGQGDAIHYPRSEGEILVHYEGELAVVIGRKARNLTTENALDAVLGYTCANDVSERIAQRKEMAMGCLLISKGWDTFCPLGPCIATGVDPRNAAITVRQNGNVKQSGNTSDLLFPVVDLLVYISRSITLHPGDVILTGSPAGVGPLAPGDTIEVEIEGIGVLSNPVELEPEF